MRCYATWSTTGCTTEDSCAKTGVFWEFDYLVHYGNGMREPTTEDPSSKRGAFWAILTVLYTMGMG